MKSILYYKLYNKYKRYTDISKVTGSDTIDSITRNKLPKFYIVASKFLPLNIVYILNYSYEDFLQDYYEHLKQFSPNNHRLIFEIYINGYSINIYSKLIGISYMTSKKILKENFYKIDEITFWKIKWIINKDKLPFEPEIEFIKKEGYAKIIGNRDTLEELKKLYSIPYPVLYYSNDLWHIAFWWI